MNSSSDLPFLLELHQSRAYVSSACCLSALLCLLVTIVTVSGEESVPGVCVSAAESAGAEEHCPCAELYLICCLTIVTVPGEESVHGVSVSAAESAGAEEHCSLYLISC